MKNQTHPTALDLFGKRREMNRQILLIVLLMTVIHAAAYWHRFDLMDYN